MSDVRKALGNVTLNPRFLRNEMKGQQVRAKVELHAVTGVRLTSKRKTRWCTRGSVWYTCTQCSLLRGGVVFYTIIVPVKAASHRKCSDPKIDTTGYPYTQLGR